MLGIDVLEADKFAAIAGKKIGLLTHPAGVNRRGESTVSVLRRATNVKLGALFAPEHGIDGQIKAEVRFGNSIHAPTGLPIYSVHGESRKPTPAMLKGLDAVVIDLQDIGARSYTFTSAMAYMMAACFENKVEVIVLDRPNPLGGLKVDGPPLDADFKSYVGVFRVPYVHGLTIGELARLAMGSPGVLSVPGATGINVTDKVRARGKLTVIPMRGWTRAMRWPDTGLKWIATSPLMPSYEATVGYAMVGLGCLSSDWSSGIGKEFPFRGLGYPKKTPEEIIKALESYKIPGIMLVKQQGLDRDGKLITGVYVEVVNWEQWHPTELSFYMHKQAATWQRLNPFAVMTTDDTRTFNIHVGSAAWTAALKRDGPRVDVALFLKNWAERAATYQQQSKKYWLYP
ncbi:MAG: DUF1343 domain-containing protein [Lacunisphaera sp.]|nr:DUF1343 domain-containing protein [Lacunisphaera sp.]